MNPHKSVRSQFGGDGGKRLAQGVSACFSLEQDVVSLRLNRDHLGKIEKNNFPLCLDGHPMRPSRCEGLQQRQVPEQGGNSMPFNRRD
jgi:hypothetical protein